MRVALLALTVAGALGTAIVLTGSPAPSNADAITPARVHVLDGDTIRLDGQQSRRAARRLQRP